MRRFLLFFASIQLGVLTGCGGSGTGQGANLTHPDTAPPTDSISGVIACKGAPLSGVTVTLWLTNTNSIQATTVTDSNGAYSFPASKPPATCPPTITSTP